MTDLNDIKARIMAIDNTYLRTLRPSIQQLLRRDLPYLISALEVDNRVIDQLGGIIFDLKLAISQASDDTQPPTL